MPVNQIMEQAFPLLTGFAFILGACVGSFLNVCIWRLPRHESLVHPGSHCPHCGHAIRPWENVPLLSWLLLRGRCSHCGGPISIRYPVVEALTGLLFMALWVQVHRRGLPPEVVLGYWLLGATALAAGIIDAEHGIIPNALTYSALAGAGFLAVLLPASHPGMPGPSDAPGAPVHFWTVAFLEWFAQFVPAAAGSQRAYAVADTGLGVGIAGAFLWAVRELARRLWGRVRTRTENPVSFVLTADGLRIARGPLLHWRDIFSTGDGAFEAEVLRIRLHWQTDDSVSGRSEAEAVLGPGRLRIAHGRLTLPHKTIPVRDLVEVTGELSAYSLPQEVLGIGDIKLLMAAGAFLGPEAAIITVFLSALMGVALGLAAVLFFRQRRSHSALPYGPLLAAAAIIWMLWGNWLITWYGRWVWNLVERA